MARRHQLAIAACLVAACTALAAAPLPDSQAPTLSLDALPRPKMPPAETGPVVPAQVQRWRQERS